MDNQPSYNPNEIVTLTGSDGSIKQVPRAQLPQYGLDTNYISQADTYANSVRAGAISPKDVPQAYSGATLRLLNQDGYSDPNSAQAKDAAKSNKEFSTIKTAAQNVFDAYKATPDFEKNQLADETINNLPFTPAANLKNQTKGAAAGITSALTDSKRFPSDNEVRNLIGLLPSATSGGANATANVKALDNLLIAKYKQGFDPEYLQQFGLTRDKNGKAAPSGQASGANSDPGLLNRILTGGAKEIAGTAQGIKNTFSQPLPSHNTPVAQQVNTLKQVGSNIVQGLNQQAGEPLKGGDVLGRAENYAIDHPLATAATVLPGIKAAQEAGVVGKVADTAGNVANTVKGKLPTIGAGDVQSASVKASDLLNGGGTKDLIARNVNMDNAVDMNKTLMDHNIKSSLTDKGKIEATSRAIIDEGNNINKALKNSSEKISSSDLSNGMKDSLMKKYPASLEPTINDVVNKMAQEGKFDLSKGDNMINMSSINQAKTGLMDNRLTYLGLGEGGKAGAAISQDAAKYLRNIISDKVPEATPSLRAYANLRTYHDDVLTNPGGLQVKGNMLNTVGGLVNNPLDYAAQKVYNSAKGNLPPITQTAPSAQLRATGASIPSSRLPLVPPSAQNVPKEVIDTIVNGKGAAQSNRLLRDNRYSQGNWQPRVSTADRKATTSLVQNSQKKRYQ